MVCLARCAAASTPTLPNASGRAKPGFESVIAESLLVALVPALYSVSLIVSARDALQRTESPPSLASLHCGIGALVGRLLGALDEVLPWGVLLRLALAA